MMTISCSRSPLVFATCTSMALVTPGIKDSRTLTFCKGGAMSQSPDTADANADEDVAVVLESLCFSCPPTIVDEQCKVNEIAGVLI